MKVFGIAGWSGSGKTTLVVRLLPELGKRGLVVSTMKHTHHRFDIDRPGKDSFVHREAGAKEVLVASSRRWALMHELRDDPEPPVEELIARMTPVDLLLVEGFKHHNHPKIEVHRHETGKPLLSPDDASIIAIATNDPEGMTAMPGDTPPLLNLDDTQKIADFIIESCGLTGGRE
ncbi:MAG: molybdopterin-guanine dinucleotide biosynthesis protein B [Rhodospirillales bacterium]|nr:molybdopterin-guanine dinucleotide biosynthesis protein B [Rhodospirillales bacterium]MCW8863037.1 molybdopterin-guanine dinucleotide biosynthesis protein B [Rhodospirillales bacterium]MCW8952872.1 molybdopterin-guanine dinucleotide biosynthesis protein B [Rhodospirillales bacterium]MCW8969756.1 molybdopterin-guanine dinucleotide biosynthesis protein B [Rhodospirillales bacterium]MCW9001719.1 molybdopterin-guanine dinucleotide biosynthesis protein B [Rhodospirillales bacterium]